MLDENGETVEWLTERAKTKNLVNRMYAVDLRIGQLLVKDADGMSRKPERQKLRRTYEEDCNLTDVIERCVREDILFEYRERYLSWAKRLDATYKELGVQL